ncbi:hypothetical protein KUG47_04410 [Falsochrobactrum sp. TDYN1]|uniref:SH3 domain-containing protein n=1 Tax=Falsochrobactrum tianjinense TaxID=2706015 RepID=A0A949PLF1_9HYPH|nr:hypothetical protein [Falsochrobactrum sp. TDYN1]MBV2142743.1 hypothetical protein [Falsochrobactrum sp. TDYN1]
MAARKRSSRSPKRSTRRKSRSGSSTPLLALGVILGLGAFSLWATSQHKNPHAALTGLFQRSVSKPAPSAPAKAERKPQSEKAVVEKKAASKSDAKDFAKAVGPVPRPIAAVAPARPKPLEQTAVRAAKLPMPPRGTNAPAQSPSVIFAKVKLTIRKNAWDKSPAIGTVEKGREMRSYGKTGRWHRVVVPSTNMIGWVHEDQLVGGRRKPDSAKIITGSIAKKPQAAAPASSKAPQKSRIKPPLAVGQHN